MTDRCPICDRADCPTLALATGPQEYALDEYLAAKAALRAAEADCYAHRVDWRARALAEAAYATTLPIRTVTADDRPPPGKWCVLLAETAATACLVYADDDGDWNDNDCAVWSVRDGDRYVVLPEDGP